ncbi:hypothetical protein [Streptomyces clavuligerus]|uniref:hypothetical protein n=1 Tax=Streptomyces clavuligerus TaxID=1901 RepID=UPI001E3C4B24|nr:hypothetical protein [Streptomyces clavuligerus]
MGQRVHPWVTVLAALLLAVSGLLAPAHAATGPRAASEATSCAEAERLKEESPRHRVPERSRSKERTPRAEAPVPVCVPHACALVRSALLAADAVPARAGPRVARLQVFRC